MDQICVTSPMFPNPSVTVSVDDSGIMIRIQSDPKHSRWCGVHVGGAELAELLGSVLVHSPTFNRELLALLNEYIKGERH